MAMRVREKKMKEEDEDICHCGHLRPQKGQEVEVRTRWSARAVGNGKCRRKKNMTVDIYALEREGIVGGIILSRNTSPQTIGDGTVRVSRER